MNILLNALLVSMLTVLLGGCAVPGNKLAASPSTDCAGCPEMVSLPPGRFVMGSPPEDEESWGVDREGPRHDVVFARGFAMGRLEVTRAQFAAFVAESGYRGNLGGGYCLDWNGEAWVPDAERNWRSPGIPQGEQDPVVCVNWADAAAYATWLSHKTGQRYRLPSEAEWEYAARAGTATRRYWGDSADAGCAHANITDQSLFRARRYQPATACDDGHVHTAPAGSLLPNAWGLHDMLGNAWEWTADCWHDSYVGAPADGSAWAEGPSEDACQRRVNRGAGWNSNPRNARSGNRGNYPGIHRYNIIGFRVVRE